MIVPRCMLCLAVSLLAAQHLVLRHHLSAAPYALAIVAGSLQVSAHHVIWPFHVSIGFSFLSMAFLLC